MRSPEQRQCAAYEEEDKPLMRQIDSTVIQRNSETIHQVETADANADSEQRSLGGEVARAFMEPRFGADFSQVRAHTDSEVVQMNRELSAQAFAHRQDIYFGVGKVPSKDELTAHELTHVVQQTVPNARIQRLPDAISSVSQCIQKDDLPEAERVKKLNEDYENALKNKQWTEAAAFLNTFNRQDILDRLAKRSRGEIGAIHQGALDHPKVGAGSQVAELTRPAYLDSNYENARKQGNWQEAAKFLNGFNETDIRTRLRTLGKTELEALKQGALEAMPGWPQQVTRLIDEILPVATIFADPALSTPAGAKKVLDAYQKLSPADRRTAFDFAYPKGAITAVLKALPAADAAGTYKDALQELLQWVEEFETRASSGKTDEQMAALEAKFVYDENKKAAEQKTGGAPATAAQIEEARKASESEKSFHHPMAKTRWEKLSPTEQIKWTDRGNKAIKAIVDYTAKTHPELKLTASNLKLAFHEIDQNAPGAFAQAGGPGIAEVGFEFVEAVEVNPAYALSTVVHELFGHPEFDSRTGNYQLTLFQQAGAKIPGYTSDPAQEGASYGYHTSEIYSLLRELPYWTQTSTKDAAKHKKVAGSNYDPREAVGWQIDQIKAEWEPSLAVNLMRGLYKRFSQDPRIEKIALDAFAEVIRKKFSSAEATNILA
ncbi:DUF4157 domain-containing protein [Cyanobacteria bacterium FACHB-63]|nr:DUF4157 domain-containing protein [Cyanobacteria bacterium FACHB-63]